MVVDVDESKQTCSFETGCERDVWDQETDLCVIHSRKANKPEFWLLVRKELSKELGAFHQRGTLDIVTFEAPERKDKSEFQIHLCEYWFPNGRIPKWLFKYELNIADSHFLGPFTVMGVKIDKELFFNEVTFHSTVHLRSCIFDPGQPVFRSCTYNEKVLIEDCRISHFQFILGSFLNSVDLYKTRVSEKIVFESLTFCQRLRLNDVATGVGGRAVVFNDVLFAQTYFDQEHLSEYRFSGCQWQHVEGRHLNRRIGAISEIVPKMQEEQFRQMRRRFSREGHAELANEFLLSETEARRNQMTWRRLEWWVLTAHKYLSFYNIRFMRPLFWLLTLAVFLPCFHMYGGFNTVNSSKEVVEEIDYRLPWSTPASIERSASLAEWIRDWLVSLNYTVKSMVIRSANEYEPRSMWSTWAGTVGMIFGPALVLLFIFSLRRRYKVPTGLD